MIQEVAYLSPLVSPGQGLIWFDSATRGRRASNTKHAFVNILQLRLDMETIYINV